MNASALISIGVVVAANGVGPPRHQLARIAVGHLATRVVQHRDLIEVTDRSAGALEQQVVGIGQPGHVDEPFGGAVDLLRRTPEGVAKTGAQLGSQACAAVLDDTQGRQVELFRDVAS